jgi:ATP-dependent DNA helicase RecG
MNLVEQVASGIPRIRDEMQEAGLPEPVFSTEGGFFTVELKRPHKEDVENFDEDIVNDPINLEDGTVNLGNDPINSDNGTVNPVNDPINLEDGTVNLEDGTVNLVDDPINLEEIIYELITVKEGMSAPEISKKIDKSLRTTKRHLAKLKRFQKIEFRGAPKTGGYYAKKEM